MRRKATPRVARKPAKAQTGRSRTAVRKVARQQATRKIVARRATAPRAAVRKVAARKTAGGMAVLRGGAKSAPAPPFAGAITGASAKHLVLFEIVRARVTLHASLQGLIGGNTEQTVEPGRWTVRETVLHLIHYDREFLAAIEPALHGVLPRWAGESEEARDRRNDEGVAPLRGLDYGEAVRRLQAARQELMSALESLPEEPVTMWGSEHALGRVVAGISRHDLHHANMIKHWRTNRDV